jgi:predicted amidohydrolase
MEIVTIVGALPQFIKAAPVRGAIQKHNRDVAAALRLRKSSCIAANTTMIPCQQSSLGIESSSYLMTVAFGEPPDKRHELHRNVVRFEVIGQSFDYGRNIAL